MTSHKTRRGMLRLGVVAAAGLATPGILRAREQVQVSDLMTPHIVRLRNPLPPGEVHVVPGTFRLFWTLPRGRAWIYPVRVGRGKLYEAGEFYVGAKKVWPSWTPTPGMIEREPERYAQYAESGMPGGPGNPLGARALYLFTEDRGDTFLRIHGTDEPETIGHAVSNGCAGLVNDHMIHLYGMVPTGARVVLYPKPHGAGSSGQG